MSQSGPTAADLVNTLSREELTRILREYGEEPFAWAIAGKIEAAREKAAQKGESYTAPEVRDQAYIARFRTAEERDAFLFDTCNRK